jgi:hypothetical protein
VRQPRRADRRPPEDPRHAGAEAQERDPTLGPGTHPDAAYDATLDDATLDDTTLDDTTPGGRP